MSKKSSDQSRAARTAALIEQQRKAERRRNTMVGVGAVVVVALLLGVGFWIQSSRDTSGKAADATPSGLSNGYGVVVGEESAPTTVKIFEDAQCPACNDFESQIGEQLRAAVDEGKVRVEYRMVSFLDKASANDYSSRALNAAMAVLDTAGVEGFLKFHDTLYSNQPPEGTAGPEDNVLIGWAVDAGAPKDEVSTQIKDKVYEQWIVNATDQMSKDGVNSTPGVLINDKLVDGDPVTAVLEAIK